MTHYTTQYADRPRSYTSGTPGPDSLYSRQPIYHPRTSLGAAGHWIHLGAVTAPLVIGELITDPDKRWRALRLVSVVAAVASEAVWTHRIAKERQKDEEARTALRSCKEHCR